MKIRDMNVALIFAGGTGKRMNTKGVPKQFLELYGKPIIIYTIEKFENNDEIDGIVISCLREYIPKMWKLCNKFHITKVQAIVPGGETGQESIYHGLCKIDELFPGNSVVLVHDGVRPLVDTDTITNAVHCVREHGSAITVTPATETIITESKNGEIGKILDIKLATVKTHVSHVLQKLGVSRIIRKSKSGEHMLSAQPVEKPRRVPPRTAE